ncbi:MAG: hypothetical protein K8H90_01800, partial [Thermoanaerobaculia bacterium]|nr:hypothetical protein [Thermoanaerobaculia bacterium]
PVDPAGSGSSRCTGCHNVPIEQVMPGERAIHDHTFLPVPPLHSNEAAGRGEFPVPPNSCAGVAGCHDASMPGPGVPHDVNNLDQNRVWQGVYDIIGEVPGRS